MENRQNIFLPEMQLGQYKSAVVMRLNNMEEQKFVQRFWAKDPSLWNLDHKPESIEGSMGWLDVIDPMLHSFSQLNRFVSEVKRKDFKHVVLMGMGGSSLAPMVMNNILKPLRNKLDFHILDSTDPATIKAIESKIDIPVTLFIVASKSGTTSEPLAFFNYFYSRVEFHKKKLAGENFIAITDPDTDLVKMAKEFGFLRVFTNFKDIGGRYSALSYFGILPAAMMGIKVKELLQSAGEMANECSSDSIFHNPGIVLGGALGELARLGRNKVNIVIPENLRSFGIWLEQLIAESTGKNGVGVLPVLLTKPGAAKNYSDDCVFVYFDFKEESQALVKDKLNHLAQIGHPVISISIESIFQLGKEFFRWEVATATIGAVLGINPFDQENVQENKEITNSLLKMVQENGSLPVENPMVSESTLNYYSCETADSSDGVLNNILNNLGNEDYIAIQAYLTETPEIDKQLDSISKLLQTKFSITTTVGYGPRYLHSTGQYHKGGPNTGVFIQLTAKDNIDIPIPGKTYTFGVFKQAQAMGDYEVLLKYNRRVIRIDLGSNVIKGFEQLMNKIDGLKTDHYYESGISKENRLSSVF